MSITFLLFPRSGPAPAIYGRSVKSAWARPPERAVAASAFTFFRRELYYKFSICIGNERLRRCEGSVKQIRRTFMTEPSKIFSFFRSVTVFLHSTTPAIRRAPLNFLPFVYLHG